ALAWHRRWIADDGLIVVRTVRNVLAGNGPVFNAFERAEANTSTLWTFVLALVCLTGANPTIAAVVVGGLLSVAGVALALDATRRWHRARGSTATLVPAGILVVLAVFPFWDFATSGLETGLVTCWLGGAWWLLVAARRPYVMAIVFGAGPLVRPELGLVAAVFLVAGWALVRPPRRQTILLALAAIALPLAYEVFRAGYYGTLVPLPALAKGAAGARWVRGVKYVWDFAKPYWLVVPAGVLGALAVITLRRRTLVTRDRWLLAAPVVAAAGLVLYVVRVGGDFMHARMLLPATFLVLFPALVLPARRSIALCFAALAVWGLYIGIRRGNGRSYASAIAVEDEHYGYVRWTKDAHPMTDATYITAEGPAGQAVLDAVAAGERALLSEGGRKMPLGNHDATVAFAVGRLGVGGVIAPLDGIVVDTFGLANPLGSRITPTNPNYPGHEKSLPWAWILADFADPGVDPALVGTTPESVRAARHAMTCGALAELLASAREPMTASRFWANLTGALARTRLEFPSDPIEAERALCR
ncbi:MAG: hypothetical protein ABI678_02090, partial [Kofleriaceae bacterium]